jgi:hypothetical protein
MHVSTPSNLQPIDRHRGVADVAALLHLQRDRWRRCKHGFSCRLARVVHNGIAVARVQSSSMLANTCCTTLLIQGAPAPLASTTPP